MTVKPTWYSQKKEGTQRMPSFMIELSSTTGHGNGNCTVNVFMPSEFMCAACCFCNC
jgi:hypothetical protein